VLHGQDYEEILARLGSASSSELAQVVYSYRGRRRRPDGATTEIMIELLRGTEGFTVEARTTDGKQASPGAPTWDLAAAITSTDWSSLDT